MGTESSVARFVLELPASKKNLNGPILNLTIFGGNSGVAIAKRKEKM
jgi:hypothetical protein